MKETQTIVLDMTQKWSVLPIRDTVVFPGATVPLLLGREYSLRIIEGVRETNGFMLLVLQKDQELEEVSSAEQLHDVGVIVRLINLSYLANGYVKALVEGVVAVKLQKPRLKNKLWEARVRPLKYVQGPKTKAEAIRHQILEAFEVYAEKANDIPIEILHNLSEIQKPLDAIQSILPFVKASLEDRQIMLALTRLEEIGAQILRLIDGALDSIETNRRIEQDVRHAAQKNQREWFIQEQIRLLQEEVGNIDALSPELAELHGRIKSKEFPEEIAKKVLAELERLPNLHQSSPEYSVVRNYIEWFLHLPFGEYTKDELSIPKVRRALNSQHYGLDKVKERILEHVAVLKLTQVEKRTPILCLVGPPGVGKTSLGQSIAQAMNREFVRITLGGVRDEAEIRGHRRTYIGSMPGRIIQSLRKAQTMNPLILLDEIDKMSNDFRGDPASAMLEVLDPEQNHDFQDHFLEAGVDLSRVLFICTANSEERIPGPLRDRMEIVRLSSYHRFEKHKIAQRHLMQKVCERNGVVLGEQIFVSVATLNRILSEYTREAGVRNLERELDNLCRKRAMEIVSKKKYTARISPKDLPKYLGVPPFRANRLSAKHRPGVVTGLAWTAVGGEILLLESNLLSGKGKMQLTGTLGAVMKESAHIALSLTRGFCPKFGWDPEMFRQTDIHIHVPEGATPKDGPSAGLGLTVALVSAFSKQAVDPKIAFTGEVSLSGKVLGIGGLTEKAIAAFEAGAHTIYLPAENEKNVSELPSVVRKGLKIYYCEYISDAIKALFEFKKK